MRRMTSRYGFIDPATLLARLRNFAEPSEVHEPLETVRAWIAFHARGIVNTQAIQHNLDWTWPYWVERQFRPGDESFIPRGYSLSHVNLTHRNWTAVGLPGVPLFPLVDPRGMVTPHYDGWSLEFWILGDGKRLLPPHCDDCGQELLLDGEHVVETRSASQGMRLTQRVEMKWDGDEPSLEVDVRAEHEGGGDLVASLRPYNPEGVQFVDRLEVADAGQAWRVNGNTEVRFDSSPSRQRMSKYDEDDVLNTLQSGDSETSIECRVGMATAAAVFPLENGSRKLVVRVPLAAELAERGREGMTPREGLAKLSWAELDAQTARFEVPDERLQRLYQTAARTVLLLSPYEVYPGPYVYRRFWYRDASIMMNALLGLNHAERAARVLREVFPKRQQASGFFESQEGEWDSNGQALWIAARLARVGGQELDEPTRRMIDKAAEWLHRKRRPDDAQPHPGLLPPGYSAEHFGPTNYYYWDNFWAVAGLRGAAQIAASADETDKAARYRDWARQYQDAIERSIASLPPQRAQGGIPAAPGRRLDGGAVGSLAADYPLQILPPGDARMHATVNFLLENYEFKGAYFHDLTHSGLNPYLTLHLAQALLRAEDDRYRGLVQAVADLASPTGQWPEAVHPATGGGCMGDGQHGWVAADWVLMLQALFVREEGERIVIGQGLFPEWVADESTLRFGPRPSHLGALTVEVRGTHQERELLVHADRRVPGASFDVRIPGYEPFTIEEPGRPYPLTP